MSEKTDYKLLKKHLPQGHDRLERIENVVGVGTPDINYCIEGVEGWIEMKSPKEPKKSSSKLFGDNHKLNQAQKNWFLRQRNAGGKAFILICTDKRWMLIKGDYLVDIINDLSANDLWDIACWVSFKPIDWESLREVLKEVGDE